MINSVQVSHRIAADAFAGSVLAPQKTKAALDPDSPIFLVRIVRRSLPMQNQLRSGRSIRARPSAHNGTTIRPKTRFQNDLEALGILSVETDPEIVRRG